MKNININKELWGASIMIGCGMLGYEVGKYIAIKRLELDVMVDDSKIVVDAISPTDFNRNVWRKIFTIKR